MQYLLTQQEFDAMQLAKTRRTNDEKAKLQALCTLAAQHIPIVVECNDDKTTRPWGCILERVKTHDSPAYCDCCPAQTLCPHDAKEWSQ